MEKNKLYEIAKYIIKENKASTNDIVKTFKLGFSEAQEVFDELESLGIIKSVVTVKREIIKDINDLDKIFNK